MRNAFILLLASATLLPISSCKKGENDPFFSLRTRKARLEGEWTVDKAELVYRDSTITYDGASINISYTDEFKDAVSYEMTWTFNFTREGEYSVTKVSSIPEGLYNEDEPAYELSETEAGTWQFTGGNGGSKTKEQLLLLPSSFTTERSDQGSNINTVVIENPVDGRIFNIDRLSVEDLDLMYSYTVSSAFNEYTESATIEMSK